MKNGILILLLVNGYAACSQHLPKTESQDRVVLYRNDSIYQFHTSRTPARFRTQPDKFYSWYGTDTILVTQGGAGGKLLHGSFRKFYPNRNLMEEGNFYYGQKEGTWKQWNPSGKLKNLVGWKGGVRNGKFQEYDDAGREIREGNFRDDAWDGAITEFGADGKTVTMHYRKGERVIETTQPASRDSIMKSVPK